MADNYLERKMEDYRSGRTATAPKRTVTSPSRTNDCRLSVTLPARIFVIDGTDSPCAAIIRTLRKAGCQVAFSATDTRAGNLLAQSTGSQFHPIPKDYDSRIPQAIQYAINKWGGIDALINTRRELPAVIHQFLNEHHIPHLTLNATQVTPDTLAGMSLISLTLLAEKQPHR